MSENLIIAGLDIGNGYVKGLASIPRQESTGIDIPSGILSRYVLDETDFRTPVDGIPAVMDDIYNQMDVIFSSPLISNGDRILFGRRAVATGRSLEEFDVAATRESKATKALSFILILGCLAGKALQVYWNEHGALPKDTIQYHVRMAVALPITEYKQYRQVFGNQFKTGSHVVTFYNFEQLVRVELVFDDVQVLAEGASAQYAILAKGEPLMNAMLDDLRAHGCPFEGGHRRGHGELPRVSERQVQPGRQLHAEQGLRDDSDRRHGTLAGHGLPLPQPEGAVRLHADARHAADPVEA